VILQGKAQRPNMQNCVCSEKAQKLGGRQLEVLVKFFKGECQCY